MEVFESWPEYKLPSGYRLIEIDFTVLFPAASSILNTWDQQKLYTVLMSEGHLNNKTIKDMLSDIENLNKTSQEACPLWALHVRDNAIYNKKFAKCVCYDTSINRGS
ncbi:uncharacterized protein [Eurosta solidaginis]|uniref:uncharacterized protein n=1 Tax=Eurosta solidaginis TaxID=178769 RepID=UPI00353066BF